MGPGDDRTGDRVVRELERRHDVRLRNPSLDLVVTNAESLDEPHQRAPLYGWAELFHHVHPVCRNADARKVEILSGLDPKKHVATGDEVRPRRHT